MIALVIYKNLCLILQSPEGGGMDYTIAISLEIGPVGMFGLVITPSPGFARFQGVGGQAGLFLILYFGPEQMIIS